MKKSIVVFTFIFLVLSGMYTFLFLWAVPKTAGLAVPAKWNMLPLRQSKDIVHNYLGEPVSRDSVLGYDEWAAGSKGRRYLLKIYYISDTIAARYSIHYQFKNLIVSRDYLIDSFSIR